MKKRIALGLALICCLGLLIWGGHSLYEKKEKEKTISYYNSEISRLQSNINESKQYISKDKVQYDNAMSKYRSTYKESEKEKYLSEARKYEFNINYTESCIKADQEKIDDLKKKINKLQ